MNFFWPKLSLAERSFLLVFHGKLEFKLCLSHPHVFIVLYHLVKRLGKYYFVEQKGKEIKGRDKGVDDQGQIEHDVLLVDPAQHNLGAIQINLST